VFTHPNSFAAASTEETGSTPAGSKEILDAFTLHKGELLTKPA